MKIFNHEVEFYLNLNGECTLSLSIQDSMVTDKLQMYS